MNEKADVGLISTTATINQTAQTLKWRWLEDYIRENIETELERIPARPQVLLGYSGMR